MFRVKAVNAEVDSEYLESGDTMLAKNPFLIFLVHQESQSVLTMIMISLIPTGLNL